MSVSKQNYIVACRNTAAMFARVLAELRQQAATWTDRGYASGGTDPLTTEDLADNPAASEVSPEEAAAWVNMAIQLAGSVGGAPGWIGTGSPTSEKVVNVMRNDI